MTVIPINGDPTPIRLDNRSKIGGTRSPANAVAYFEESGLFAGHRSWPSRSLTPTPLKTFVERADSSSRDEYNIAYSVATLWGGKSENTWWQEQAPFCFGDLCVFERLAIDAKTASRSHATWTIINSLLQRLCRRDMAAIVLKAFPLEYEGNTTKENRAAFERRRRALVRLYQGRLGFEPVSDPPLARAGWMLKLINDGAEPERLKRC